MSYSSFPIFKNNNNYTGIPYKKIEGASSLLTRNSGWILCSASTSDYAVTLPPAASMENRFGFVIKKTDDTTHKITISTNSPDLIDGFLNYVLVKSNETVHLISDGCNWLIARQDLNSKWRTISNGYSMLSFDTLSTTEDFSSIAISRLPIRYKIGDYYYYGICQGCSPSAITILGPPITSTPTQVAIGTNDLLYNMKVTVPGAFGATGSIETPTDLISSNLNTSLFWTMPTAYLVSFGGYEKIAASSTHPKINMKIGNNLVSNNDDNYGITMSTSWTCNPSTAINPDNYGITTFVSPVKVEACCTYAGSTPTSASDLSLDAIFVFSGENNDPPLGEFDLLYPPNNSNFSGSESILIECSPVETGAPTIEYQLYINNVYIRTLSSNSSTVLCNTLPTGINKTWTIKAVNNFGYRWALTQRTISIRK